VKIVILGATGFLGGLVTSRLAHEGHQIVCLVRNPDLRNTQANVEYVLATLDDTQAVAEHASDADYLLHFAWDTTPGTSKAQPAFEAVNNLLPTFRLIEQLHSLSGIQLIFVSSSGAIYDESGASSFSELSPLNPKSYYGAGKLAVEMFLRAYSAQTTHPVVLVRPSNVYGPGQSRANGNSRSCRRSCTPSVTEPLSLFGGTVPRRATTCMRKISQSSSSC